MTKEKEIRYTYINNREIFYGSIDDLMSLLQRKKQELEALGVEDIRVETETYSYEYSETEYGCLQFTGKRPETDQERAQREKQEMEQKEWRRREFEALKKEFEK